MVKEVNKAFVYGVSVGGNNFTDRIKAFYGAIEFSDHLSNEFFACYQ